MAVNDVTLSNISVGDVMSGYAQDAIEFAKEKFAVKLDYSVASVEKVEEVAEKLFRQRPTSALGKIFRPGPTKSEIETMCKMLGSYVGEVLRAAHGGEWAYNIEMKTVGLQRGNAWVFPSTKVLQRLTNGSSDNLWAYFRTVAGQWGSKQEEAQAA